MDTPRKTARVAGVLYLLLIVTGVFAEIFVRQAVKVPGDAAATASNILASQGMITLGFFSDLMMLVLYVMLVLVLYMLLNSFGKYSALFMVSCVLVSTAIMSLNLLNHFAPLMLLSGADYLSVFTTDQLNAFALLSLNMHEIGYHIAQPFFGLWLFPLGYLGYKSGYFPRIITFALMASAFTYQIDLLTMYFTPDMYPVVSPVISIPGIIGEFGICLWLLVMGVWNVEDKEARPLETAAA